jgi:hypothetical protein
METTVNILDPMYYATNPVKNLLIELSSIYNKKYILGHYIIKVVSIVSYSDCNICKTNDSGNGYVDVKFKADVMNFHKGTIIVGAKVVSDSKSNKWMTAHYSDKYVSIALTFNSSGISNDQLLCLRIDKLAKVSNREIICASSNLFQCQKPIYCEITNPKIEKTTEINLLIKRINDEYEKRNNQIALLWKIESLLTPVKTQINEKIWSTKKTDEYDLFLLSEIKHKYFIRDKHTSLTSKFVKLTNDLDESTHTVFKSSAQNIYISLLVNILDNVTAINKMVNLYSSPEIAVKHQNIWALMEEAQLKE